MPAAALNEAVALQAAQWFFLLKSGEANAAEHDDFARWRTADPMHELAWQRAERVSLKFGVLPQSIALPVLGRTARTDRRTAVKTLAALLTAAPAGWLAWRASPARDWTADHRTATGERRDIVLPDGTRVQLNTASAIDVAFDGTQRTVRLRAGEILVDTAPDTVPAGHPAYRPFVVETEQGRLKALGTRFVVRHDTLRSRVAVFEGAVEVTPAEAGVAPLTVAGGHQAFFSGTEVRSPEPIDPHAADWSRGILHVRDMRLADFAAELGRYRPGLLRCDPAVAELRISGAFQLRDTTPVLDSLPQALPVDVIYRTRFWVTLVAPGA
ncbi:FecR domain-containing protein [soil metagenome]